MGSEMCIRDRDDTSAVPVYLKASYILITVAVAAAASRTYQPHRQWPWYPLAMLTASLQAAWLAGVTLLLCLERAKPWRMARHALVGCGAIGLVGNTAIFTFNGGQLNGVTFTPGNASAYVSFPLWSLMLLGGISYNEKLRTAAKFVASSLSLSQIGDRELSAFAQAQPAELHDEFKEGDHHDELHDACAGEVVSCAESRANTKLNSLDDGTPESVFGPGSSFRLRKRDGCGGGLDLSLIHI